MQAPNKKRVLCLGNELMGDDGVGVRVGRVLAGLALPAGVVVRFAAGAGFDLLDHLRAGEELVLVDATATGASPGSCRLLELEELALDAAAPPPGSHGATLWQVLRLARRLQPDRLPARVALVGIEAAALDRIHTGLSAPVQAALPRAVALVLRLLGADDGLVRAGERRARELAGWRPGPADLPGAGP